MRNIYGEAATNVPQVIFDGLKFFFDIWGLGARSHADGAGSNTRKSEYWRNFNFMALQRQKTRNDYGEAMTIASLVILWAVKVLGISSSSVWTHVDSMSYNIQKSGNQEDFYFLALRCLKIRNGHREAKIILFLKLFFMVQ